MPVTITRRTRAGLAIAGVLALALSACSPSNGSDGPSSSGSGTLAASSSAVAGGSSPAPTSKSASPTPIPASSKGPAKNWPVPKMPEAAKKHTLKGAGAFSEYYFELIEYTSVTNESAPIRKVSSSDCDLCQNDIIKPAIENAKNGGWITGGKFHPSISSAQKEGTKEVWVSFKYLQDESRVYDPDKVLNRILHETSDPVVGSFYLEWNHGWQVNSVELATT
ncbi:DUF6318 family protein [Arthrobacter rhombi]|uniref:DUF6318 family protein n=1 Tax=Arthrobacter rhombi TaxID=71253 RepID=UPI0031DC669E